MSKNSFKIKICGLTRVQDAQLASDLGAWALGFIFYKLSPRAIQIQSVESLLANLRGSSALKIGVFVDEPLDQLINIATELRLDGVQLHGKETPTYCHSIKNSKIKVIKAFRPQTHQNVEEIKQFKFCDHIIVDSFENRSRWDLAQEAKKICPIILAGGLHPENILKAAQEVNPYGYDVSSGVEISPGIKSEEKLRSFFKNLMENKK